MAQVTEIACVTFQKSETEVSAELILLFLLKAEREKMLYVFLSDWGVFDDNLCLVFLDFCCLILISIFIFTCVLFLCV